MSSTSSRIRIIFDGDASGVERASAAARLAIDGLGNAGSKLGGISKVLGKTALGMSAVTTGARTATAAVATLGNLAPGLLLVPGALASLGAVAATVKIGLTGFGDAVKGDADAMAKLAPSARDTAQAFRALGPAAHEVRTAVQGALFKDLAPQVRDLGGKYLPLLRDGLSSLAQPLNGMARGFAEALKSGESVGAVRSILESTRTSLAGIEPAAGNVATAFLKLAAFGAQYFAGLGQGITGLTEKFKAFVDTGVDTGRFTAALDRAGATLRQLGDIALNVGSTLASVFSGLSFGASGGPLDSLQRLTAALAQFFATAQAQSALTALGDTFRTVASVVQNVLIKALAAIGPVVEAAAPIVQDLARAVGQVLGAAFEQLGPKVQALLTKLQPIAREVFPAIAAVITGVVIPAIGGLIDQLPKMIDGAANFALTTISAFTSVGSAVGAAVSGILGALGLMAHALGQLPGGERFAAIAKDIGQAKLQVDGFRGSMDSIHDKTATIQARIENGESVTDIAAEILGLPGNKQVKIVVDGDLNPITGKIDAVITQADGSVATVHLDGDPTLVDGKTRQAVTFANGQKAVITLDGNPDPATGKVNATIDYGNGQIARITLDAKDAPARDKVTAAVTFADGSTGTMRLDGDPQLVNGKIEQAVTFADGSTGTITIEGDKNPADGKTTAAVRFADGSTGTVTIAGDNGGALSAVREVIAAASRTVTMTVRVVTQKISNPFGLASGGPVVGPGTGTSDTAGLFRLSNGEHVFTAAEVRAAGGHGAILRLRRALAAGQIPRLADGGTIPISIAAANTSSTTKATSAPQVDVRVFIGDQELRGMVRTEIDTSNRATRRTVAAGAGVTAG